MKRNSNMLKIFSNAKFFVSILRLSNFMNIFRYRLRPLVLNDVSRIDISTTVLGNQVNFPICATPFGMMRIGVDLIGCDGAEAVARGRLCSCKYSRLAFFNAETRKICIIETFMSLHLLQVFICLDLNQVFLFLKFQRQI